MNDPREIFIQSVIKMLPKEDHDNAAKYIELMDAYFEKLMGLINDSYSDEGLPLQLRVATVRRMAVAAVTTIFFSEGIKAVIETGRACAMNILMEKTARELKRVEEQKRKENAGQGANV